jgi:hypothetical protein
MDMGAMSTPVISIDDEAVVGFDETWLKERLGLGTQSQAA